MPSRGTPDKYKELNVQLLTCTNELDDNGNPTGGEVVGPGLTIHWQKGPRTPDAEGNLAPSNGAFVEDVIYAAIQRLEFFQDSPYKTDENEEACVALTNALVALDRRRQERKARGVEGKHEV
jgi:hypothetical protein